MDLSPDDADIAFGTWILPDIEEVVVAWPENIPLMQPSDECGGPHQSLCNRAARIICEVTRKLRDHGAQETVQLAQGRVRERIYRPPCTSFGEKDIRKLGRRGFDGMNLLEAAHGKRASQQSSQEPRMFVQPDFYPRLARLLPPLGSGMI